VPDDTSRPGAGGWPPGRLQSPTPDRLSLDLSKLAPFERKWLAEVVDYMSSSATAECVECQQWVPRHTLREHLEGCLTPVVRTRRLEVLDEHGTVTVVVGDVDGEMGLAVRDAFGADQLVITRDDGGAGVRFYVGGNEVASFGVDTEADPERDPGAYLMLAGFDGAPGMSWKVGPDGKRVPTRPAERSDDD
jgi:hypothetical protein